ncbi:MAG: hypothetical protein R3B47_21235 [Bacteroidia bacterium]
MVAPISSGDSLVRVGCRNSTDPDNRHSGLGFGSAGLRRSLRFGV